MVDRQRLTDLAVRNLKPRATGQYEVWDHGIPGFGVRVSPSGTKAFVLLFRRKKRQRRLTLGRYPTLSLAQARSDAMTALRKLAGNVNPLHEKDEARHTIPFATVVDKFVALHCLRHNRASTAAETERLLRVVFMPQWRPRNLVDIRKPDVLNVLDAIMAANKPSAANHAFAAVRKLFNWCVARGYIETSPCYGLSAPSRLTSRDRVLRDDELVDVWNAASEMGYPFAAIVHLLILTAQRRGEVASAQWPDFDFTAGTWSIPAEIAKSGRTHVVPLSPSVIHILLTLPKLDEKWLFPARSVTGQHYRNFTFAKARLSELVGLSDWTLHDLRRTAATGMAKLAIPPHVVERVLSHRTGILGGVAGVYNRFGYLDEMRRALQLWEGHVTTLVGPLDQRTSSHR